MKTLSCIEKWGTPAFEDAFKNEMEMNDDEIPLERIICHGGFPESVTDISIDDKDEDDNYIYITFTIYFKEAVTCGCPDMAELFDSSGKLDIIIDKNSGEYSFPKDNMK